MKHSVQGRSATAKAAAHAPERRASVVGGCFLGLGLGSKGCCGREESREHTKMREQQRRGGGKGQRGPARPAPIPPPELQNSTHPDDRVSAWPALGVRPPQPAVGGPSERQKRETSDPDVARERACALGGKGLAVDRRDDGVVGRAALGLLLLRRSPAGRRGVWRRCGAC